MVKMIEAKSEHDAINANVIVEVLFNAKMDEEGMM